MPVEQKLHSRGDTKSRDQPEVVEAELGGLREREARREREGERERERERESASERER